MSPVGCLGIGPCGDQDGNICEEQGMLGGAEMADTDEESGYSNVSQERRKYVLIKMSFNERNTAHIKSRR